MIYHNPEFPFVPLLATTPAKIQRQGPEKISKDEILTSRPLSDYAAQFDLGSDDNDSFSEENLRLLSFITGAKSMAVGSGDGHFG